ncbi:nucleoside phosphorylase-like protein [Streptosporangium roseum]|uniref:Nucleoside phosphorylase-like protein n=1 Tax=Streptosporangium roseum (strain ATCC 12428 / DSM 43021 / JCM 3005 / KCTC 9067 / NCIMB 10171 / NRRL 2505 / NI 9100) TaxID=479432 RepID=D2BFS9_STRRD|nr:nucleoside phosphorylase-like protein [Streptosporangium roseum]ACZ90240.1 Nucleoside phosphorylase-like protein [Streptosporangium roseum DSM 43021]
MNGNSGIVNYGGSMEVSQSAVGHGATVNIPADREKKAANARRADVGVITILTEEARAVHNVLGLERAPSSELPFFDGTVNVRGVATRVAAIRALAQGQRSTMMAFDNLRRHYNPAVVVLTGIGGGIHKDIAVGDVVLATRVVYYDLRKETPDGRQHRGEERETPAAIGHAVHAFFTDYGEPAKFHTTDTDGTIRDYRVLTGPIGSGEAVIADAKSEIIRYLKAFNDKILAVDMEAGGLTQAFHERGGSQTVIGWAVVRGISDDASSKKNDDYHEIAARHAATVLRNLLPYLMIGRT